MNCPVCSGKTRVYMSKVSEKSVNRSRICSKCGLRFKTIEQCLDASETSEVSGCISTEDKNTNSAVSADITASIASIRDYILQLDSKLDKRLTTLERVFSQTCRNASTSSFESSTKQRGRPGKEKLLKKPEGSSAKEWASYIASSRAEED